MLNTRKKRVVVVAVAALVGLLGAIGGYAYWSITGSGSATTAVGTASNGTVTLTASIPNGIYPGGTRTVSYSASNTSSTDAHIGTVSVTGITVDAGHSTCVTGDFSVADTVQNVTVPAGASNQALPTTGSLVYANTALSQDACKGATLTLTLSSS